MTGGRPTASSGEGTAVDDLRPRVMIVDDESASRARVAELLEEGGCVVVGTAMDGVLALRQLEETPAEIVVCDLEMPRMDGFTFLRILAQTNQIPVLVLTSFGRPESALLALELGARDFVVKPARLTELRQVAQQLLARIRVLTIAGRRSRGSSSPSAVVTLPPHIDLVAIGASTGGPRALREIIGQWSAPPAVPVVIAQHMPPLFTGAFADRLRKTTGFDVAEAEDGGELRPGFVRVAPGATNLVVERRNDGALVMRLVEPAAGTRWVPSVDVLFDTASAACGAGVLGVVLTGMGRDGEEGSRALAAAGAPLWVESPETAAIDGMPVSAARGHRAARSLPLDVLGQSIARLVSGAERRAPRSSDEPEK